MTIMTKTFAATGVDQAIFVPAGESAKYFLSGTFVGTLVLQKSLDGANTWQTVTSLTAGGSGSFDAPADKNVHLRWNCTAYTSGSPVATVQNAGLVSDAATIATLLGTLNSVAGLTVEAKVNPYTKNFKLDFKLQGVAVTHTDAAGSGSSGSLKLWDFIKGCLQIVAAKQDLTFATTAAITTAAGDMAFIHALGSAAANAGDAALTGTEADIAAVSGTVTCVADAATSKVIKSANTIIDGDTTAVAIYFNESGSAATSDANGTVSVSGTISISGVLL